MAYLAQPCAGSNAATVTTANATSGNQWDGVNFTGTGETCTYDNAQTIHGSATSIKQHWGTVSSTNWLQWKASIVSPAASSFLRFYVFISAKPTTQLRLAAHLTGTNTLCGTISLGTAGAIKMNDSAGALIATMTANLPLGAWCRIEYEVTGISGTTGNHACRLYSGANLETLTPDTGGTITGSSQPSAGLVDDVRVGTSAATTEASTWDINVADVAWCDFGSPGPLNLQVSATEFASSFTQTGLPAATVSASETAAGVDNLSASSPAAALTGADTGDTADTAVLAAAITGAESALPSVNIGSLTAAIDAAETGAAADVPLVASPIVGADTAAGVDTATIAAAIAAAETLQLPSINTGSVVAAITAAEAAAGAEVGSSNAQTSVFGTDTAHAVDAAVAGVAQVGYVAAYDPGSKTWVKHPLKVWNGRQWTTRPIKSWDGTTWKAYL